MSNELLRPVYAEHVNTKFRARLDEAQALELELIRVVEIPSPPAQEQFSLVFRGPSAAPLSQRTYELEHEQMGATALMLVPIGIDQTGRLYEACFNRLLQ